MRALASYIGSLLLAAVGGLFAGEFILYAMAGMPNRSGGGSWDIGPVIFPIISLPMLIIGHAVVFGILSQAKFHGYRLAGTAVGGAAGYVIGMILVAVGNGYKG